MILNRIRIKERLNNNLYKMIESLFDYYFISCDEYDEESIEETGLGKKVKS